MKIVDIIILVSVLMSLGLNAWILTGLSSMRGDIKNQGKEIAGVVEEVKKIQSAARPSAPAEPTEVKVSVDDDPIKGDPKAPITVIEFSDYQCPFCRRFHEQVLPQLESEYISKGKVRYIFRDYPLEFHKQALPAAMAANCAGDQGKYWELNDFLFKNPNNLDVSNILSSSNNLGLNREELEKCINEKKYESEINKDFQDGQKYGVSGTPSFFVGKTEEGKEMTGSYIRGARPYQAFKTQIDKLLSEDKG